MSARTPQVPLPEAAAAERAFDRASVSFEAAAVVHDEARRRLLERLGLVRLEPRTIVDLGCGTGSGALALAARYPHARVLAVDRSAGMLRQARRRSAAAADVTLLRADAERLPLTARSVDLLFSNLLLPWCMLERVLSETSRVLADGGLLLFSTVGPDTLQELRRAWRESDAYPHVHAFIDMHDIGDRMVAAGFAEPVLDVDRVEITYADIAALVGDLRNCGAVNVAAGRRGSLTGKARWRRFEAALEARRRDGRLSLTAELVFGQAWGGGRAVRGGPRDEFGIPAEELVRALRRR